MAVHIGVVGSGEPNGETDALARRVGADIAGAGAVLVCGGLGGVMASACRGATEAGGVTIGLLPGDDRAAANEWVGLPIATGLGEVRNTLVVRASDALVAIGGEYGTLSEVAFALKVGRPVVGVSTWTMVRPDGTEDAGVVSSDAENAVRVALALDCRGALGGTHAVGGPPHGCDLVPADVGVVRLPRDHRPELTCDLSLVEARHEGVDGDAPG